MAAAEVQALLRFLTQDAKIPLSEAMPKIATLRKHDLKTSSSIAQADINILKEIFVDDKTVKQIVNAAKRVSNPKKRTASQITSSHVKRSRNNDESPLHDLEAELSLPTTEATVDELKKMSVETNRAPLVLAFALVTLEFTMPEQPLSSRLSLAQAVVSANSQTKAKSIGLAAGATAEEEGWAQGQPKVRIMTREIAVMRRQTHPVTDANSQDTVGGMDAPSHDAFWGLDVEALRRSNGPLVAGKLAGSQGPPIHTPQSARSYLLKSFSFTELPSGVGEIVSSPKSKKKSAAEVAAGKERALATLLQSIRIVCESWASTLSASELDRRAWSWYLAVRPDVAQGQSGWGQRGNVQMVDIINLRRNH